VFKKTSGYMGMAFVVALSIPENPWGFKTRLKTNLTYKYVL
jgi:hypothetical protein